MPASNGKATRRRSRSSPRSISRRASSPTDEKEERHQPAVHPLAKIQRDPCVGDVDRQLRAPERVVRRRVDVHPDKCCDGCRQQNRRAAGLGAQELRSGVSTLRAQAVRPEKNAAGLVGSLLVLIGAPADRGVASGGLPWGERERNFVDVAPAPVLAGLGGANDRMAALALVCGRVLVRR